MSSYSMTMCPDILFHSFVVVAASGGKLHKCMQRSVGFGSRYQKKKKLIYDRSWIICATLHAVTPSLLEQTKTCISHNKLLSTEE